MIDSIIANAKIVTPMEIIDRSIVIDGGRIEMVAPHFLMPNSRQLIDGKEREKTKGCDGLKAWTHARLPFTEAVRIEMDSRQAYEANAP